MQSHLYPKDEKEITEETDIHTLIDRLTRTRDDLDKSIDELQKSHQSLSSAQSIRHSTNTPPSSLSLDLIIDVVQPTGSDISPPSLPPLLKEDELRIPLFARPNLPFMATIAIAVAGTVVAVAQPLLNAPEREARAAHVELERHTALPSSPSAAEALAVAQEIEDIGGPAFANETQPVIAPFKDSGIVYWYKIRGRDLRRPSDLFSVVANKFACDETELRAYNEKRYGEESVGNFHAGSLVYIPAEKCAYDEKLEVHGGKLLWVTLGENSAETPATLETLSKNYRCSPRGVLKYFQQNTGWHDFSLTTPLVPQTTVWFPAELCNP